jgi:hypothetical protein
MEYILHRVPKLCLNVFGLRFYYNFKKNIIFLVLNYNFLYF